MGFVIFPIFLTWQHSNTIQDVPQLPLMLLAGVVGVAGGGMLNYAGEAGDG